MGADAAEMRLSDYRPRSMARPAVSQVSHPAAPVVDAHNHLGRWLSVDGDWLVRDVAAFTSMLDTVGVETVVNLDGRWGDELAANVARFDRAFPNRYVTFGHLDWRVLHADAPYGALVAQVDALAALGARGIKIWKDLGLSIRDRSGELVVPDDPRVVAALTRAGELGLPVLVHTGDPAAFFEPLDAANERIEELGANPDWWFGRPGLPGFDRLLDHFEGLVAACPATRFVGAHVGGAAEDLARVGRMLAAHPNLWIDLGGRMAELGRQPRAARRLIVGHPDRILFGTDAYPPAATDYLHWYRFLETADECFDYAPGALIPPQGRWQVSALDLPADVLRALYAGNARRVLGG